MEIEIDSRKDLKSKIENFYKNNKFKIFFSFFVVVVIIIVMEIINLNEKKNNIIIAEKYVRAGIYLSSKKEDEAKKLFEEIILSKNEVYSVLALNSLIEKKLVLDDEKILSYFDNLEKFVKEKDHNELITFKKALYMLKYSDYQNGEKILNDLVEKNSKFKNLALEILDQ